MLISQALAQDGGGGFGGGGDFSFLIMMAAIFAIFYFFMIRPQQKRAKQHKEMLANLRRGDKVITSGGFIGTVTKVDDEEATVEIADGVKVRVVKQTIADLVKRTEPASGGDKGGDKGGEKKDD